MNIARYPLLLTLSLLAACATVTDDQRATIDATQDRMNQHRAADQPEPAPPTPQSIEYPREQAWLYRDTDTVNYTLPLRDAVHKLIPGQPVAYRLPPALNPTVSTSPGSTTIKDHLDSMAMQANVHWAFATGTIVFTPTRTRQYEIPLYGGATHTTQVNSNNLGSDTAGITNAMSSTSSLADELTRLISTALQISPCPRPEDTQQQEDEEEDTTETPRTLAGIPQISKPDSLTECFSISGAGNIVTITARPQTLVSFETTFSRFLASLNRNVNLKIITVKIDVTDLQQQRLDLDLVWQTNQVDLTTSNISTDLTSSTLSSAGEAVGAVFDATFTRGSSPWANSAVLLQNLKSISNISVEDSREVLAYSNRLITIQDTERFSYVKEVRRDPETVGQTTTIRTSITSDEIFTGQALNILPSLTASTIGLHIVINESTLTNIKTDGTEEARITLPDTANSDVVFDVTLKDGQTALIASSIRTETTAKEDTSGLLPIPFLDRMLANSAEGMTRTYQTVYVIEASFRN